MRLTYKIIVPLVASIIGIALFVFQNSFTKRIYEANVHISVELSNIDSELSKLMYNILESNGFLYSNYDKITNRVAKIEKALAHLKKGTTSKMLESSNFKNTRLSLDRFSKNFLQFKDSVFLFLRYNSAIKNSTIYLPSLVHDSCNVIGGDDALRGLLLGLNTKLLLLLKTHKMDYLDDIVSIQNNLQEQIKIKGIKNKTVLAVVLHLDIIKNQFREYLQTLKEVTNVALLDEFDNIMDVYEKDSYSRYTTVNFLSFIFLVLYIASVITILYYIIKSEKENRILQETKDKLEESILVDPLTGLGNREKCNRDKKGFKHPALIIFNIDKFKHINEFYGNKIGDLVLKRIAKKLRDLYIKNDNIKVYRFGGDEFSLLFEYKDNADIKRKIESLLEKFNNQVMVVNDLNVDISIYIGASYSSKLFETTDMALKHAKESIRDRFVIYNKKIDVSEKIAKNIVELKNLNYAIENDGIIPYFQPIVDLKSGKVIKYETLIRIRSITGEVLSPYHFLDTAKEAKISGVLTSIALEKSLQKAKETGYGFSVNIFPDEINNKNERNMIYEMLMRYKDEAKKITFEILESEKVENYEVIVGFMREVKKFGSEIAIDDFGSGYSNFEKLLRMHVDILKIDGSLIKDIDHDKDVEMVVKTIKDFAKSANIKIVAEYIHSKSVLDKVKSLGIEMGQGFYFGRPEPYVAKKTGGEYKV